MNIFVTDLNPEICARQHPDKLCIKMILESAQLLCTAINVVSGEQITPYKTTHINHPCSIWVRESKNNFIWLYNLMIELGKEYTYRYNKNHKTIQTMLDCDLITLSDKLPDKPRTKFAQAMPDKYKSDNVIIAYQNYINGEKRRLFSWKNREIPEWICLE